MPSRNPAPADSEPRAPAPDWTAVRELFEQALALPDAERAALLAGRPAGVAAEVRSLLAHAAAADVADDFLREPAAARTLATGAVALGSLSGTGGAERHAAGDSAPQAATPAAGPQPLERHGQRVGAWRIVARLGSGGMGEVWLAERADGAFQGEAAIKILRRGMDSQGVLARFALERQALARLTHPHIARLLDAGTTPDGLPYFVMEHVRGRPIDEAARGLPLPARLALFLQLADAVSHAHRNLLVHRDLKPGNVLVEGEREGDGKVKLLDFGIAKALDPLESGDAGLTLADERPFTPHYASPEQVRGEPVSTATDIYSLGVLLYVLLTGRRPYGRAATTPREAARSVLEEQPTRPSALLPEPVGDPQWLATRRQLAGDLDTIVLKALAKPATERYASVDALAADLRAHLAGLPISARPAKWRYVFGRFVARNRLAVAAVALGSAAVLAALTLALWQAHRAERARELAERRFAQVRQLAHDMIFRHHDQVAMLPGSTATREALLADAVRFLDGLRADELADPALAREVAEGYHRVASMLGEQFSPSQERVQEARVQLQKALALQAAYVDAPGIDTMGLLAAADMWLARASQSLREARLAEGLQALQRARTLAERAVAVLPPRGSAAHAAAWLQATSRLATVEGRLGQTLGHSAIGASLGRPAEAEPHLRRSLALMEELARRDPGDAEWLHQAAWANQNLVGVLLLTGRADEALPFSTRTVELRHAAAKQQPSNAHYRHQQSSAGATHALVLALLGRHDEAWAQQQASTEIARRTAAADAANRSAARDAAMMGLAAGRLQALAGAPAPARALLESALGTLPPTDELRARGDFYVARLRTEALLWLARSLPAAQAATARRLAREARTLMAGDDDNAARRWALAQALGEEAAAAAAEGAPTEARALARQALAEWKAAPGARAPGMFSRWQARDEALAR
ncbi:MAG: serine/threonine protein kinase [Rubrivivax sp.]|nr:serine/threonine protein kinase [Rubrivivax sp.]